MSLQVLPAWFPACAALAGFTVLHRARAADPEALEDLADLRPDWLVPAHCTGWRAQHAMSARLGDVYVPNAVGTSFHFLAGPELP